MRSQIDSLNPSAREFYERSRFKLILSLIIASFGMMFLAMVAGSGASAAAVGAGATARARATEQRISTALKAIKTKLVCLMPLGCCHVWISGGAS